MMKLNTECYEKEGKIMSDLIRYAGKAEGRVQGVGFRMFVQQHARELHLTGWVANMEDGSVDMELQGEEAAIEKLDKIIRAGNYFIRVKSFSLEEIPVIPGENDFKIRY